MALARRIILWLLIVLAVAYVVTGFGITEFRIVELLTFGLLHKNLAFRIHNALFIPTVIATILHVLVNIVFARRHGARHRTGRGV